MLVRTAQSSSFQGMAWQLRFDRLFADARRSNLRPSLKGETLKNWLGDNFENGPVGVFQESLKKGVLFQNILQNRVHFQTAFEKNTPRGGQGLGGPGPGPRTQAPTEWGIFSNSV